MSTLISSLSEFLALVAQSFNLGAVLPSFGFILLNYVYVRPMLKGIPNVDAFGQLEQWVQLLLLVTATAAIAYFLTAVNTVLIRVLEGYPVLDQFPFDIWRSNSQDHVQARLDEITTLDIEIKRLNDAIEFGPLGELEQAQTNRDVLQQRRDLIVGELLSSYPITRGRVLPTRLGNIIAAAEDYPNQLFGIDAVVMWPYLVPALTDSGFAKFVEREKSIFDLLLNSMVMVTVLTVEIGWAKFLLEGLTLSLGLELAAFVGLVYALYYVSAQGARGWASTIRTAFVLYRHKMVDALGLIPPISYENERATWERASEFYREPAHATEIVRRGQPFLRYADHEQSNPGS